MKGEVEKVWSNQTADGRKYNVLQISGERYSLWDEGYLDKLQEGQSLEFDFRESGEFRNISRIYEPNEKKAAAGPSSDAGMPEDKLPEYGEHKTRQIIRMSCLRSASQILGGSRIPAGKRAGKTIEIARKFEKYIDGDAFVPEDG